MLGRPPSGKKDADRVNSRAKKLAAALFVAVAVAGGLVLRRQLGIEGDLDPTAFRAKVEAMGPLAPAIFVAAVALRFVLFIPSAVLLTVGGAIFGLALGTLYGALGITLMGLVQYLAVHVAGAESLRAHVPARFEAALRAARSWRGAATLAVVSAYPVGPQTPVQLAAALAGMSLVTFLASVAGGGMLRAGLFSWFGSSLLEGDNVLAVAVVMLLIVAAPFVHPRTRATVLSWVRPRENEPG